MHWPSQKARRNHRVTCEALHHMGGLLCRRAWYTQGGKHGQGDTAAAGASAGTGSVVEQQSTLGERQQGGRAQPLGQQGGVLAGRRRASRARGGAPIANRRGRGLKGLASHKGVPRNCRRLRSKERCSCEGPERLQGRDTSSRWGQQMHYDGCGLQTSNRRLNFLSSSSSQPRRRGKAL